MSASFEFRMVWVQLVGVIVQIFTSSSARISLKSLSLHMHFKWQNLCTCSYRRSHILELIVSLLLLLSPFFFKSRNQNQNITFSTHRLNACPKIWVQGVPIDKGAMKEQQYCQKLIHLNPSSITRVIRIALVSMIIPVGLWMTWIRFELAFKLKNFEIIICGKNKTNFDLIAISVIWIQLEIVCLFLRSRRFICWYHFAQTPSR